MTTPQFNKLFDYHHNLDKAYQKGKSDGYFNGYDGNLYNTFVPLKKYKNKEMQEYYNKGYEEGYHQGWLDS